MVSLFKCHGLTLEGSVLAKPAGVSDVWCCHALLNVQDPASFTVAVEVLTPSTFQPYGFCHYLVGIVPKSCSLAVTDIESKAGVFLDLCCN